ncbi:MAG: CopD family protein [Flavobacteriales bacterium]
MDYNIIKSLHIIFVVTWFAGLFYMFRLFVYHAEAARKDEPARSILMNQYSMMEKRLWYAIAWPSCVLTLLFGLWLLWLAPHWLKEPWMHIKLLFVVLLFLYQLYGERVLKRIGENAMQFTSIQMRLLNEVPTVILIAVIFLVVMKREIHWIWGTLAILVIGGILTFFVMRYKKRREESGTNES